MAELNAHLPERIRPSRVHDETNDEQPRTELVRPLEHSQTCDAIRRYFGSSSTLQAPKAWTSRSTIPTAEELLSLPEKCQNESGKTDADCEGGDWSEKKEAVSVHENHDGALDASYHLSAADCNIVDAPWPSKEKYLRTHYKLLREDAVRPLRDAIQLLKRHPQMNEPESHSTIGLYDEVNIVGVTFANRGLGVRVAFTLQRVQKNIKWEQSKRLMSGSLVVLMPVQSNTVDTSVAKVATVAARSLTNLAKNPPEVDLFFAEPEQVEIDSRKKWLMIEDRSSYFEAFRTNLTALQKMAAEEFPLHEHLVGLKNEIEPPTYLTENPFRSLQSIFTHSDTEIANTNLLTNWPENLKTDMDQSQFAALENILTKRLSVIQGPPGTGKTWVTVKALKVFLNNMSVPKDPPIVIACQTNHALDQIGRHAIALEPDSFVRLGARSKDKEIVSQRTIYKIRDNFKPPRSATKGSAMKRIKFLTKQMKELLQPFRKDSEMIESSHLVESGVLSQEQIESMERDTKGWKISGTESANSNVLQKWVGEALVPTERNLDALRFFEFEEAELELEDVDLDVGNGEEDVDVLEGDFVSLQDKWKGVESSRLRYIQMSGKKKTVESVEELLNTVDDMGRIEGKCRGAVFNHWMRKIKERIIAQFRQLAVEYSRACEQRLIGRWEEDSYILRHHKVIGVTTTGFSKWRGLLASLKPKIVVIEEAAETLEGPVAATCIESLEHLILVGDQKQLRPHCNVRELENHPHFLNISLFERLVDNGVKYEVLQTQRRMVPPIRELLIPIYGEILKDHPSVKDPVNRPPVPGMGARSRFFFTHEWPENRDDQMSCFNEEEAQMVLFFIRYLIFNSIAPAQITVLTFYNGQKRKLEKLRTKIPDLRGTRLNIVTVDSYQGEENDIVILSLVRSNQKSAIGFLAVDNRVCVALSRARRGFYMFGNGGLLRKESNTWSQVMQTLSHKSEDTCSDIGDALPLLCKNHLRKTWIREVVEWNSNVGGCNLMCGQVIECGHTCPELCHPFTHENYNCTQTCGKGLTCGHLCNLECCAPCKCEVCGPEQKRMSTPDDQIREGIGESKQRLSMRSSTPPVEKENHTENDGAGAHHHNGRTEDTERRASVQRDNLIEQSLSSKKTKVSSDATERGSWPTPGATSVSESCGPVDPKIVPGKLSYAAMVEFKNRGIERSEEKSLLD